MKDMNENAFIELAERLYDRYGVRKNHYTITKAEQTERGWRLEIERVQEQEEKSEGAKNESN